MLKFNMNNYVYFKPTQLGKKVFKDYYKSFYNLDEFPALEVNEDGYAKLQFHNFIDIYGEYITSYYSAADELFEAYEFYLNQGDLI